MANQKQLLILEQGVEVWNQWRIKNYETQVDLREANLCEANLRSAILSQANLCGANLNGAVLCGAGLDEVNLKGADLLGADLRTAGLFGAVLSQANLCGANLNGAVLCGAGLDGVNLKGADLLGADLCEANLLGANLSGANLRRTNLREADLRGANLSGANLSGANLRGTNLSGLDLCSPNLRGANLNGANLSGTNLSGANLNGANLSGLDLCSANLRGADLSEADLRQADLREANLCQANLCQADLCQADLCSADLRSADLRSADLSQANLSQANLREANLRQADLREANLCQANLCQANLSGIDLKGADLLGADLSQANLSEAKLSEAKLIGSDLSQVNLSGFNLSGLDLNGANLSGTLLNAAIALFTNFQNATLTGACIQDWNINEQTNLEGVICDYIYLKVDYQDRKPIYKERRPHDPNKNFNPGEFTKLFQKALETVDLIFSDGIDWNAFLTSFQGLQIENCGREISIQAIEKKRDGAFVIRIDVPADVDKAAIEASFKQKYSRELEAREQQFRQLLQAKDKEIMQYRQQSADFIEIIKLQACRTINVEAKAVASTGDTYNQSGQFGIGHMSGGEIKEGAKVAGVLNEAEQRNLSEAVAEVQQILNQLEQSYPTNTTTEQMTVALEAVKQIESQPNLKRRLLNAAKEGGLAALEKTFDNPVGAFIVNAIKGWQQTEN